MKANEFIIVCDNVSERHGKKRRNPVIRGFVKQEGFEHQRNQGWVDHTRSRRVRANSDKLIWEKSQKLVENEKYDPRKHRGVIPRDTLIFECEKCGYSVSVRDDKLFPALTKMHELGLDRIGITSLSKGLERTG